MGMARRLSCAPSKTPTSVADVPVQGLPPQKQDQTPTQLKTEDVKVDVGASGKEQYAEKSKSTSSGHGKPTEAAHLREMYESQMAEGLGPIWRFKYFRLFPVLQFVLLRLDHYSRVLFPLAFIIYTLVAFGEIGFGAEHYELLMSSTCWKGAS